MKRVTMILAALAMVLAASAGTVQAGPVGYDLQVTTGYDFGNPFPGSTFLGGGSPSPDTGFFRVMNLGSTTFTGTIGDTAVSPGGDFSFTSGTLTLAPGAS